MRVLTGDRIGIYNINATAAVPYRLEPDAQTFILPTESVQVGQNLTFDTLNYPYVFGVAAYAVDSANGRLPVLRICTRIYYTLQNVNLARLAKPACLPAAELAMFLRCYSLSF